MLILPLLHASSSDNSLTALDDVNIRFPQPEPGPGGNSQDHLSFREKLPRSNVRKSGEITANEQAAPVHSNASSVSNIAGGICVKS